MTTSKITEIHIPGSIVRMTHPGLKTNSNVAVYPVSKDEALAVATNGVSVAIAEVPAANLQRSRQLDPPYLVSSEAFEAAPDTGDVTTFQVDREMKFLDSDGKHIPPDGQGPFPNVAGVLPRQNHRTPILALNLDQLRELTTALGGDGNLVYLLLPPHGKDGYFTPEGRPKPLGVMVPPPGSQSGSVTTNAIGVLAPRDVFDSVQSTRASRCSGRSNLVRKFNQIATTLKRAAKPRKPRAQQFTSAVNSTPSEATTEPVSNTGSGVQETGDSRPLSEDPKA